MTQAIRLYGTPLSNYYNKVKIALLEQNRPFEEILVRPADRWPEGSPTGKVPYLETPDGCLVFESQAIIEYLEETRGQAPSLYPVDAIERARRRLGTLCHHATRPTVHWRRQPLARRATTPG